MKVYLSILFVDLHKDLYKDLYRYLHKDLYFSYILSVPQFTANLYCICLSIDLRSTKADAVQICSKFWDTQYNEQCELTILNSVRDVFTGVDNAVVLIVRVQNPVVSRFRCYNTICLLSHSQNHGAS